ncbi:uncharacterized protein LOC131939742 [Physella acuta]|uniref:uncharacterized protein LOC131939742 n=1 Tax=Physella acuta TaxID=109671 RepID=UPI0027DCEB80|nr:uncharacterized protein LOC131939742 [Physella acuta]
MTFVMMRFVLMIFVLMRFVLMTFVLMRFVLMTFVLMRFVLMTFVLMRFVLMTFVLMRFVLMTFVLMRLGVQVHAFCGAKTGKPWDERFPVRKEDVTPDKKGGSRKMAQVLPENIVAPTGVYHRAGKGWEPLHRVTKKYIHVPEMVPEFVVPDLTGFELKPYVSYKAREITQLPLTPQDIFKNVYAEEIKSSFEKGELKIDDNNIVLANGKKISIDQ